MKMSDINIDADIHIDVECTGEHICILLDIDMDTDVGRQLGCRYRYRCI